MQRQSKLHWREEQHVPTWRPEHNTQSFSSLFDFLSLKLMLIPNDCLSRYGHWTKKKKKKKGIVSWRTRRRGFNSCCHDWGGLYHSLSQVYTITVRFLSDYIKIFKCFEAKKHHNPKHKSINKIRFLPLVPETVTAGPPRGGRGTILLSWLSAVTQTMTWTSAGYYCW